MNAGDAWISSKRAFASTCSSQADTQTARVYEGELRRKEERPQMMAASCTFLANRAATLFLNKVPSACSRRNTHSQSLWEELLGRKIEPAAAKKLEEAFLEYRVRKAVPSWLPFLPNCSFWIPSSEETIKNLQVLAERIKVSKPMRKDRERVSIYKPPPNWSPSASSSSEQGKIGAISKVAEWSLIQHTDRLLSGTDWGESSGQGTLVEVALGEDDNDSEDDDSGSEEELEAIDETKPKGT